MLPLVWRQPAAEVAWALLWALLYGSALIALTACGGSGGLRGL